MIKKLSNYCVYIFLFIIYVAYPLVFKNGYYDMGIVKHDFFVIFNVITIIVMIPMFVFGDTITLSITDKLVLSYLGINMISFLLSDYKYTAWHGADGWYLGLFSQIIFMCIYFFIKNMGTLQAGELYYVVWLAFGGTLIPFVLGILNRFSVYPIEMAGTNSYFISTIGNINWYCGYWAVFASMGVGLFLIFSGSVKIISGLYCFLTFLAGFTQGSSSALLVAGGCGLILIWQAFHSKKNLVSLFELILIMSLAVEAVYLLGKIFPGGMNYYSNLLKGLISYQTGIYIFIVVLLLLILIYRFCPEYDNNKTLHKVRFFLFCALLAVGVILVLSAVTKGVFVFDENFGNGRGSIWKNSFASITKMNICQILFGVGPDCFQEYLYSFPEIANNLQMQFGDAILTNAHCEILNIFINTGLLGTICYVILFFTIIRNCVKKVDKQPILWVVILGISGYLCISVLSFAQIMSTPFVFILMGLGERICEQSS